MNNKFQDLYFDTVGNAFLTGYIAKIDLISLNGPSQEDPNKFVGDVNTRLVMTYPTLFQLRDNLNKIIEEIGKRQQAITSQTQSDVIEKPDDQKKKLK
jgi:hypothetical protein